MIGLAATPLADNPAGESRLPGVPGFPLRLYLFFLRRFTVLSPGKLYIGIDAIQGSRTIADN